MSERPEIHSLNYDALLRRCMGNLQLAERVVDRFLNCFDQEFEQLSLALGNEDMPQLSKLAHRLKGSALTVSAERLADLLWQIEQLSNVGEVDSVVERVEELSLERDMIVRAVASRNDA